jgi:hypothetical protein
MQLFSTHQTIPSNNWQFIWWFCVVLWRFGEISLSSCVSGCSVAYLETTVSELEQLGE